MSSVSIIVNANARPVIVSVVLPPSQDPTLSGRIRNICVRGVDSSGWLADDGEGGWTLSKAMERKGLTMLEDRYADEKNSEGWALYQRYIKDWQAGKTQRPFPDHLLPKAVQDLQRGILGEADADPWNLPAPTPTTGAVSEGKGKTK